MMSHMTREGVGMKGWLWDYRLQVEWLKDVQNVVSEEVHISAVCKLILVSTL